MRQGCENHAGFSEMFFNELFYYDLISALMYNYLYCKRKIPLLLMTLLTFISLTFWQFLSK